MASDPQTTAQTALHTMHGQRTTEAQQRVACYLFLSPYHPETWPMELIDRLVAVRQRDEREFLIAVRSMTYGH